MKKIRLIAAMSLVGLGLSGLSGCGELPGGETNETTKASISISVNGTAVEANGSVSVDELTPFTLKATVNNGEADDVVSWGSSTPNAFTFSSSTGLETTATANYASSTPITLFAQLQDDASVKTTINVTVDPAEREYQLSLNVPEDLKTFTQGDAFTTNGLEVMVQETVNGSVTDSYLISEEEYTVSIAEGTILSDAGRQTVTVTATDETYGSATYDITVTENVNWGVISTLNSFASDGYAECTIMEDEGQNIIVPYKYVNDEWIIDEMNGFYYHSDGDQINAYELYGYASDKAPILSYTNIVYDNGKVQTDFEQFKKDLTQYGFIISDWDSSLASGISYNSDTQEYDVTGSAKEFFLNLGGYNSSVTPVLGYIEQLGVIYVDYYFKGELYEERLFSTITEAELEYINAYYTDVVTSKDSAHYTEEYFQTQSAGFGMVDLFFDKMAGDNTGLSYSSYGTDFTYTINPKYAVVSDSTGSLGYYLITEDSLFDGDTTEKVIEPGVLIVESSASADSPKGVIPGAQISNIAKFRDELNIGSPENRKFYNLARVEDLEFVGGMTGYAFVFTATGSDLGFLEDCASIEFGYDLSETAATLEDYKVEVSFYFVEFEDETGETQSGIAGGNIMFYTKDGGEVSLFNGFELMNWGPTCVDEYAERVMGKIKPVETETPAAGEETEPVEPQA